MLYTYISWRSIEHASRLFHLLILHRFVKFTMLAHTQDYEVATGGIL